jgi:hypothetical protein
MGQSFTAVNIDKREHENFTPLYKLGEFLFNDDPHSILYHLLRLTITFKSPCDDNGATSTEDGSAFLFCFSYCTLRLTFG